jgi:hypothetical protein
MESLIFLVKKQDGWIKACTCANGSTQHAYTEHNEAASQTAMTELILMTASHNRCKTEMRCDDSQYSQCLCSNRY